MNIKFDSDDNLPLNKVLKFHALTIFVRSVFERDGKYYPQIFLDEGFLDEGLVDLQKQSLKWK